MRMWKSLLILMTLNSLCWGQAAKSSADSLMACLPDDTILCISGSSLTELKPQLEQSILGRFYQDQGIRTFAKGAIEGLSSLVQQEINDSNMIPMAIQGLKTVAACPRLLAMGYQEQSEELGIYGIVILDATGRKAEVTPWVAQLEKLIGQDEFETQTRGEITVKHVKDDDVPLYWAWVGERFLLAINDHADQAINALQKAAWKGQAKLSSISSNGDLMVGYVNLPQCVKVLKAGLKENNDEELIYIIEKIIQATGLETYQEEIMRIGVTKGGFVANMACSTSGPRQGFMALMKPVKTEAFQIVPPKAMEAYAWDIEVSELYELIMNGIRSVSQNDDFEEIEAGLSEIEAQIGVSLQKDLLEPFQGPMVVYNLPQGTIPEASQGGMVWIAQLSDSNTLNQTCTKLIPQLTQISDGQINIFTQTISGRTYYCCAIPTLAFAQVMPTLTVSHDHVVFATNVPLCNYAIDHINHTTSDSLYAQESFKALQEKLPAGPLLMLEYTDNLSKLRATHTALQQIWPSLGMVTAQSNIRLPFILPPIYHLIKDLKPTLSYTWEDEHGIYQHQEGSTVELGTIAGVSLAAGIMMPALARTRQLAQRMQSGTNLSAVGKACLLYANDHDDQLPSSLEALVEQDYLPAKCLVSRLHEKNATTPHYIYISGQSTYNDPTNVVAYDNLEDLESHDGVNVLYLDSHVAFVKFEEFEKDLEATYKRLGKTRPTHSYEIVN